MDFFKVIYLTLNSTCVWIFPHTVVIQEKLLNGRLPMVNGEAKEINLRRRKQNRQLRYNYFPNVENAPWPS